MARQADIELLIGALGGASPSGATANLIRGQIQSALGKNNPALVKVKLSNQGLRELKAQIESITANIKVAAISSGGSSSAAVKTSTQAAMEVAKAKSQQIALDGQQKRNAQELINAERVLREEIKTNTLQRQQQAAVIKAEAAAIRANMSLESARTAQQKKANVETEKQASLQAQCSLEAARFEAYIRTIKPKGIQEFSAEIQLARQQFSDFQLDAAKNTVKHLTAQFKAAGYEGGNAFTYLHSKVKSFMTYLASSAFTMLFVNTFRNAKQAVVDLNKALVDLRMVTGGSIAQTEQLIKQYNKMAQELGVTTTAITEAAVGWQRQGYSLKETETLIRNSTILAKVGFLDAAEAQQYLTSMMKGYQISVGDSLSIVDKLAAVDASAAVSAGGLAEAISKTANSARLAGVDLDTLIGYLAAVGEVTQQDMSSLGNAFKTLFARYSNVKLGRLEDDEGESLNDYETVLKTVGISLRNAQGEFREFGEVFDEVVAEWGDLDNVTKSAVAQALGSTRQREGVLTLLDNIDNAAKYTEISLSSAGNAVKKFEAYGEGLEAKAATMKAAFEGMSSDIIPDWVLGSLYDLGTFLARLLDMFGGLPARVIAFTAAVTALGTALNTARLSSVGDGFSSFVSSITSIPAKMSAIGTISNIFAAGQQNAAAATTQLASAFSMLTPAQIANYASLNRLTEGRLQAILAVSTLTDAQRSEVMAAYSVAQATTTSASAHVAANTAVMSLITSTTAAAIAERNEAGAIADSAAAKIADIAMSTELSKKDLFAALTKAGLTREERKNIAAKLEAAGATGASTVALGAETAAVTASTGAWKGLTAAIAANPIGAILTAITILLPIIAHLISGIETTEEKMARLEQEGQELSNTIKTISNDFKTLKDSADTAIPRFAELAKGVNAFGDNVSLTEEEYKEFISLNNQMAELFPDIDRGLDGNSNHMLALSYNSDTLTKSLYDQLEAQRQLSAQKLADKMPDVLSNIHETIGLIEEENKALEARKLAYQEAKNNIESFYDSDVIDEYKKAYGDGWESEFQRAMLYAGDANTSALQFAFDAENHPDTWRRLIDEYTSVVDGMPVIDWRSLINSEEFVAAMGAIDKGLKGIEGRTAAKWAELNPVISASLQTNFVFNELNGPMQDVASKMVGGINFKDLGLTTQAQVEDYIHANVLMPLYSSGDDVEKAFQEIADFGKLFQEGKISSEEYGNVIRTAFSALLENMDPDKVENFKTMFVSAYGDATDTGADFNAVLEETIGEWAKLGNIPGPGNNINSLKTALAGLSDETTVLRDAMAALDSGTLEKFLLGADNKAENLKKLKSAFPDLIDEVNAYSNGLITAEELQRAFSLALTVAPIEQASNDLDKLSSALSHFKSKGSLESSDFMNLQKIFGGLDEYQEFERIASDSASTFEQVKAAADKLGSAYLNSRDFLAELNEETAQSTIIALKNIGITNAEVLVQERLAAKKLETKLATMGLTDAEWDSEQVKNALAGATESEIKALQSLRAQEVKNRIASIDFATATMGEVNSLLTAAKAAGVYGKALQEIARLESRKAAGNLTAFELNHYDSLTDSLKNSAYREIEDAINGFTAVDYTVPKGDISGGSKSGSSDTEAYTADVKEFYNELAKVDQLEADIAKQESLRDSIDESSYAARIDHQEEYIRLLREEQTALNELNTARRAKINESIGKIHGYEAKYGVDFGISYDAKNNRLSTSKDYNSIINSIGTGKAKDGTKKVRQDLKELFDDIFEWNDANVESSEKWVSLVKEGRAAAEELASIVEDGVADSIKFSEDKVKVHQNNKDYAAVEVELRFQYDQYNEAQRKIHEYAQAIRDDEDETNDYIADAYSELWWRLEAEKQSILESINDNAEAEVDDRIERLKNQISLDANHQEKFEGNLDYQGAVQSLKAQKDRWEEIKRIANEKANEIRAMDGFDPTKDEWREKIQYWRDLWWEADSAISEADSKIVEDSLARLDNFIQQADNFNWWDNIDTTKADMLEKKLETIHRLYADGIIPDAATYKRLVDETAKEIYDEKLNAIEQVIDYTKKLIEEEVRLRKEELEEQVDDYKKIVDLKKESLRASKDEADYQKSVAEKTKAIAQLQQQINTLALSDDRRDIAERKKLEEELAGLQGELADTQADHTLEAQEKALDDSYDAFEKEKNDEVKKLEATIDTEGKLYTLAIERIDKDWDALYSDLMQMNSLYWDGIAGEAGIKGAWDTAKQAAEGYKGTLETIQGIEKERAAVSGTGASVGSSVVLDKNAAYLTGDIDKQKQLQAIGAEMQTNSQMWHTAYNANNKGQMEALQKANQRLANKVEKLTGQRPVFDSSDGYWKLSNGEHFYEVYHKGGIVGSDEEFAKVEKGELIVPKEHVKPTMKMLEWGNTLASKMRGLFSGGSLVPSSMSDAIKGTPLSPAAGAIVNNNTPTFAPQIQVEVKYDNSASPADAKRFGENITAGITEAFRRKGIGTGAKPLGVTI